MGCGKHNHQWNRADNRQGRRGIPDGPHMWHHGLDVGPSLHCSNSEARAADGSASAREAHETCASTRRSTRMTVAVASLTQGLRRGPTKGQDRADAEAVAVSLRRLGEELIVTAREPYLARTRRGTSCAVSMAWFTAAAIFSAATHAAANGARIRADILFAGGRRGRRVSCVDGVFFPRVCALLAPLVKDGSFRRTTLARGSRWQLCSPGNSAVAGWLATPFC